MTDQAGTPPAPAALSDHQAIADLIHLHCRGLDRLDVSVLQSCYWPDAQVDYGDYVGPAQGFAELVVAALKSSYELTRHTVSNTLAELDLPRARCESHVNADHLLPGADREMCFAGRYLDLLEKRKGQWRILHRRVVIDWARVRQMQDLRDKEGFARLARGGHGSDDPLHHFLRGDPG